MEQSLANLVSGSDERDFWVWVDPADWLVRHNIAFTGAFVSPPVDPASPTLMFLPDPAFKTFVSPFQNNLLRAYAAEYNLELTRAKSFPHHPCRLHAIFLLESFEQAEAYALSHPEHVARRVRKRVHSVGSYAFSIHDSSWVDFMRLGGSMDQPTVRAVTEAYWRGEAAADCQLQSMGKPWTHDRIPEVLYIGRVDFYDRGLDGRGDR